MANGLPTMHLSVRVPWNDTDWTGRVCRDPAANVSCSVLKNIKEHKNADEESLAAGELWPAEATQDEVPPCALERGSFMRTRTLTVIRTHAYAKKRNAATHGHFQQVHHRMDPYSFEAVPFRWTNRDTAPELANVWDLDFEQGLEDRVDQLMNFKSNWVQDHRNQKLMLDSFFSAIRPQTSLVFVYAKDIPLLEERTPGARILMGVGRVTSVGPLQEWPYSGEQKDWPVRSFLWERAVGHSIRPDFTDGFLLPYRQLLAMPELADRDLSQFVARAPDEHWDEFSMSSEHVTHDGAISALVELARVVDLCEGTVDGPWTQIRSWLSERLSEVWVLRGAFPGLGSALSAAGIERGPLVAQRVADLASDRNEEDLWAVLSEAFDEAIGGGGPISDLVGRVARRAWKALSADPKRLALARLLSQFPLLPTQARRLFDETERSDVLGQAADADILDNPYLIYELDRGRPDSITLASIDRGLFPQDARAQRALSLYPLADPVTESNDDRRVRAACVQVLETAAADGSTVLDEPGIRRRLADLPLDPPCDPPNAVFDIARQDFAPTLTQQSLASGTDRAWQLARYTEFDRVIAEDVATRAAGETLPISADHRAVIDSVVAISGEEHDELEDQARSEKAEALRVLLASRVGILIGPAGTGKTTLLRALCSIPDVRSGGVLLLAPTGKARVQLGSQIGVEAQTIAQFLRKSGRWHPDFGYRLQPTTKRNAAYRTVIVDEASMLTEEMLGAVLDAVTGVDRLVLAGDHRQLPPIGAGRPFVDLIRHLQDAPAGMVGAGFAELSVGRRQRGGTGPKTRDDLALAAMFAADLRSSASDQTLARILEGDGDGTVQVVSWTDEDDLHDKVAEWLVNDEELGLQAMDSDSLKVSLGATAESKGHPMFPFGSGGAGAENWQLLTPVRARTGGMDGLNSMIRRRWRPGDLQRARSANRLPGPMGADQVLFYDKVMCLRNHKRDGWLPTERRTESASVANGEIGMVVSWPPNTKGLKVEFTSQPGRQFTFWESQLNSDKKPTELLELAYAVTIHKAQGSQFSTTLVVLPNPCPLLSPELIYTALTRQRQRTVLFLQGDPAEFRVFADPGRSVTASRLTCLFEAPEPFITLEGNLLDARLIHRTATGVMVRSKSEVIVADTFTRLGIEYEYETRLSQPDGSSRLPDFTVRMPGRPVVYWEHLGLLDKHGYRADWEGKLRWYALHGIEPMESGGGPAGTLVWSTESVDSRGIDSAGVEALARSVFGL